MTQSFLIVLVVVIAVFDIYIIAKKGKYHSISAYIIRISHKYPSIPFLLGFVCGHLFWSMKTLDIYECHDKEVRDIIVQCADVQ